MTEKAFTVEYMLKEIKTNLNTYETILKNFENDQMFNNKDVNCI